MAYCLQCIWACVLSSIFTDDCGLIIGLQTLCWWERSSLYPSRSTSGIAPVLQEIPPDACIFRFFQIRWIYEDYSALQRQSAVTTPTLKLRKMASKFSYRPAKHVVGTIMWILLCNTFTGRKMLYIKKKTIDMTFDPKNVDTALCLCLTSSN